MKYFVLKEHFYLNWAKVPRDIEWTTLTIHTTHSLSYNTLTVIQHTHCHTTHSLSYNTLTVIQHTHCHTTHSLSYNTLTVIQHTHCV